MPHGYFRFLACFLMLALLGWPRLWLGVAPRDHHRVGSARRHRLCRRGCAGRTGPNFKGPHPAKGPQHRLSELEGHKPIEQVVTITAAQKFAFNRKGAGSSRREIIPRRMIRAALRSTADGQDGGAGPAHDRRAGGPSPHRDRSRAPILPPKNVEFKARRDQAHLGADAGREPSSAP